MNELRQRRILIASGIALGVLDAWLGSWAWDALADYQWTHLPLPMTIVVGAVIALVLLISGISE